MGRNIALYQASSSSRGWMCFLQGLPSPPAPSSSPAAQEQGLAADFQYCRQIPSFGIHHLMAVVERPAASPAPQPALGGALQEPTLHQPPPGLCACTAQIVSNWKSLQPRFSDLEGK